jgi:5-methylcytosine-specific restriction endonuclease McrA
MAGGKKTIVCQGCGKTAEVGQRSAGKFCSKACASKNAIRPSQAGSKNSCWRGGVMADSSAYHKARRVAARTNPTDRVEVYDRYDKLTKKQRGAYFRALQMCAVRPLKRAVAIDRRFLVELILSQDGKCVYCRRDFRDIPYQFDHITPMTKNGTHSRDNLQLLCETCNNAKRQQTHEEFLAFRAGAPRPKVYRLKKGAIFPCHHCGTRFYRRPSEPHRRCCSKECSYKNRRIETALKHLAGMVPRYKLQVAA